MATLTTQQKLDEAIAARHALLTGKGKASIGYGERRVEYVNSPQQIAALERYIAELRRDLAGATRVRNRVSYVVPD